MGGERCSSRLVNVPSDGRGVLLPEGAGMLPDGTPDGAGKLEGTGMLPEGMGILPEGMGMLPEGMGMLPEGMGMLYEGTGMLPEGILDGLPDG
jgi:hypothetical protein